MTATTGASFSKLSAFPDLAKLVADQIQLTPQHANFLGRRFASAALPELAACDILARQIDALSGGERNQFLASYDFICKIQKVEELFFRRHKRYQLTSFKEAIEKVYSDRVYMQQYMRGLLLTQVFWSNHTASIGYFTDIFLAGNPPGYDLLEIGPGHGLLLARAVADKRAGSVTGWDLSEASLGETRHALAALGHMSGFNLEERNLFDSPKGGKFDAIVFSEVLEHMEEPKRALQAIRDLVKPGGRVFINVPINSPAPDHIFLLRSPEEAIAFVEASKFRVVGTGFFPATNYSMEQARKHALTISVCLIATPNGVN